ncbi:MAG TPA: SRPBCC family protein [Nocardioides sp.]|nr:SRPBCC family protein [Nocardioides sp.]
MSRRWHTLQDSGDDFLGSARFRYVTSVDVPVGTRRTWQALTAPDTLTSWTPLVTDLKWTTPPPFDVGTQREVTLLRVMTIRENYFRWEEGRRKTFTGVVSSLPGLRRLAEDYMVEATPTGSRFTWTLAVEPHPALSPLLRILKPTTSWLLRRITRRMRSRLTK